jgi:DNA-binding Lrp family transcriptional regulator
MKAYVLAKIQTGNVGEALAQFRAIRGVVTADMTFGPYDVIATLEAENLNALGQTIAWQIQCVPGVIETVTCLAVEPGGR